VTAEKVREELGDVFNNLLMLADKLDVDLLAVAQRKIMQNGQKYPVAQSRGNAKKYTELKQV
jgi:dCTP diphosphatase